MLWIIILLLALQVRSQVAPTQHPEGGKFYSARLQIYNVSNYGYSFNLFYPASFNRSEPPPQLVISLASLKHVSDLINDNG